MKIQAEVTALKHQVEFASIKERNSAIVGGFGSGKSQAVVYRALERLKTRDYAVVCVIAPTYSLAADVNIPDFENIFDYYHIRYEFQKVVKKMLVNSGGLRGEIWFRTGDKPEKIIGFDATDIIIDEFDVIKPDKQKELWNKCLARIRGSDGATISVATTPEGFRETYRLFQKERIGPLVRAKTTDNIFLPKDYIQSLYKQYDDMLVRQYINAEFVNISGAMAYYAFSRDKNHAKLNDKEIDAYPYFGVGWDFNVDKMCATLFVHDEARKRVHFFDEIILKNYYGNIPHTRRVCEIIREKYPDKSLRGFPDATGRQRSTQATVSDIAIIKDYMRVYAHAANPIVRDRLNAANTKFGDVTVTVDTDACPELTEDLEQTQRDKYGDIDKSDAERSHASDSATYPIAYLYPIKRPVIGGIRRSA